MKLYFIYFILFFTAPALHLSAQEQQVVPFTLADRDRIARTEMKIDALEIKMDAKYEAIDTKFEVVFWILGIMMSLILFTLGYVIWDRHTALIPAIVKATLADEKSSKIITVLRELAFKYPEIEEKMKTHGLM